MFLYCDLEFVHTWDFSSSFPAMSEINKTGIKGEPTTAQLVTFYTDHGVCQRLLSVIHQLSVSAGLAHACWSINFYVDLSKQAECETSVYEQDTFNQLQTFSQNHSGTAGWLLSWHVQLHLISSVLQDVVKHGSSDLALSGSKFVKKQQLYWFHNALCRR